MNLGICFTFNVQKLDCIVHEAITSVQFTQQNQRR